MLMYTAAAYIGFSMQSMVAVIVYRNCSKMANPKWLKVKIVHHLLLQSSINRKQMWELK